MAQAPPSANPNQKIRKPRPNAPGPNEYRIGAVTQESEGTMRKLRGAAVIETTQMILKADEIDYNDETGDVEARGHVRFESFKNGEKLECDRAEYNTEDEKGKFYEVTGSSPAKIDARPGLLTTSNPFYFKGKWAERLEERYILHEGFITDCLVPKSWWILKGKAFNVVPGESATTSNAVFRLKGIPVFYFPYFYKSLKKNPRRSGFLTPNIGNSSRRGLMVGAGYYWAISRSYDLMYRGQYFSSRGLAHNADFRGKINDKTDFNFYLYGVNDRGLKVNGVVKEKAAPGYLFNFKFRSELGRGWVARADINYLDSFLFRQTFSESFNEAITAQSNSTAYVSKQWSSYGFNVAFQRIENFQSTVPDDKILLRKLPEISFIVRERQLRNLPIWFSLDSSAGLLSRSQPLFQTRQFVERLDVAPRVTTAFHWLGIHLVPSFGVRETLYGSSIAQPFPVAVTGDNLTRSSRDVTVDLILPSISKIFETPKWAERIGLGKKLKHSIEPRATYRYVSGVADFSKLIRFDETELVTNTNEVEFSLTNRLYGKDKVGTVNEAFTWQLWYKRFFDPTFGGAVIPGQRNVIQAVADITGFTFIDGFRRQSPVVSALRYQNRSVGVEWRTDYDIERRGIANSGLTVDGRFASDYFVSIGHTQVRSSPILSASANQFRATVGYGQDNKKGWGGAVSMFYDYRIDTLQYLSAQVTYNTDCCGFSVQLRRFAIGTRNENQFRVAFAISNIGTFGTLRRQDRIF